jgi:hypothetical protein
VHDALVAWLQHRQRTWPHTPSQTGQQLYQRIKAAIGTNPDLILPGQHLPV